MQLTTGHIYVAIMTVAGLLMGVATQLYPAWSAGVPPLLFLLGVALMFDVVVNNLASQGKMQPLQMPWRFAGFIVGGILSTVVPMLVQR